MLGGSCPLCESSRSAPAPLFYNPKIKQWDEKYRSDLGKAASSSGHATSGTRFCERYAVFFHTLTHACGRTPNNEPQSGDNLKSWSRQLGLLLRASLWWLPGDRMQISPTQTRSNLPHYVLSWEKLKLKMILYITQTLAHGPVKFISAFPSTCKKERRRSEFSPGCRTLHLRMWSTGKNKKNSWCDTSRHRQTKNKCDLNNLKYAIETTNGTTWEAIAYLGLS